MAIRNVMTVTGPVQVKAISQTRLAPNGLSIPDSTRAAIVAAAGGSLSVRRVAGQYGVSGPTVLRCWRRAGIDREAIRRRNTLVTDHIQLAERIARSVAAGVPSQMRHELRSIAISALTELAGQYDRSTGVPFGAFCQARVRGACLDSIRRRHWKNGTAGEFTSMDSEARADSTPSIETTMVNDAAHSMATKQVRTAIQQLPGRYAVLMWEVYVHGNTLEQLAARFDVGASRLSQLHTEGIRMMRERVKNG